MYMAGSSSERPPINAPHPSADKIDQDSLSTTKQGSWYAADSGRRRAAPAARWCQHPHLLYHQSVQQLPEPGARICETPELTVPGIVGTQVSAEMGLQDAGRAETTASRKSGPSSPAHVLVHRKQESEGVGELPQAEDLGSKRWGPDAVGGSLLLLLSRAT